ncbi:hypothetical protein [Paraburkholderia fungorum]|uniref:Immunity protein 50 n=1 Tax=Paraburkholderia fungorum TaxID=134537 RepID=A0AAW3URW7_9BURK|nr:hypothetical protein [Paraburkholderia fungorum]MBB4513205.1 hypothetical protein [Paraburkholderia fungorum]MBB6201369.1 hypothetical protein [Paraburkholderia fungorum]
MTTETLAAHFQRLKGSPIRLGEAQVFAMYESTVPAGQQLIRISRDAARETPTQGLRLKISPGKFEVNDQLLPDVVLWANTCPEDVTLSMSSEADAVLKIWNVWSVDGTMHAWLGNAGMLVEQHACELTLRCSDGVDDICFSDLVVRIRFTS